MPYATERLKEFKDMIVMAFQENSVVMYKGEEENIEFFQFMEVSEASSFIGISVDHICGIVQKEVDHICDIEQKGTKTNMIFKAAEYYVNDLAIFNEEVTYINIMKIMEKLSPEQNNSVKNNVKEKYLLNK
jgi:hypothetical protein